MKLSLKQIEDAISLEKEIVCDVNPSQVMRELDSLFDELNIAYRSEHIASLLLQVYWAVERYINCPKNTFSEYHQYGGIQGELDWIHSNFTGTPIMGDRIALYKLCKFLDSHHLAVSWGWLKACLLNRNTPVSY